MGLPLFSHFGHGLCACVVFWPCFLTGGMGEQTTAAVRSDCGKSRLEGQTDPSAFADLWFQTQLGNHGFSWRLSVKGEMLVKSL